METVMQLVSNVCFDKHVLVRAFWHSSLYPVRFDTVRFGTLRFGMCLATNPQYWPKMDLEKVSFQSSSLEGLKDKYLKGVWIFLLEFKALFVSLSASCQ